MSQSSDQLQRFLFDATPVRGEWVHLEQSYQEVLKRHDYPAGVAQLLGELLAATALLTATVKLDGRLSLELRGQGAVRLMMAECNTGKAGGDQLRALARYDETPQGEGLTELLGGGQLVITMDPLKGQRYQGIVALNQPSLAACLEDYFASSEQLPTGLWLASDGQKAAGLLLQQLPATEAASDPDAWPRISHLAATITTDELLALSAQTLLTRLFHEETLRVFPAHALSFGCTCSSQRTAEAMMALGKETLEEILAEEGELATQCQFCLTRYAFDAATVRQWLLMQAEDAGARPH